MVLQSKAGATVVREQLYVEQVVEAGETPDVEGLDDLASSSSTSTVYQPASMSSPRYGIRSRQPGGRKPNFILIAATNWTAREGLVVQHPSIEGF